MKKQIIAKINELNPINLKWFIKNNFIDIFDALDTGHNFAKNLYNYLYSTKTCVNCGSPAVFISFKKGYRDFCSAKCSNSSTKTLQKKKQTNIERYGFDNPMKNKNIAKKVSSQIDYKQQQQKIKKTNQERYGVNNVLQSKEIKEKIKKTNQEKYGVDNPAQSEVIKRKTKKTNQEKYGESTNLQTTEVKNKLKALYKDPVWLRNKINKETTSRRKRAKEKSCTFIKHDYGQEVRLLLEENDCYALKQKKRFVCDNCNKEFLHTGYYTNPKCPICDTKSKFEKEMADFLSTLNIDFEANNRQSIQPYELDFFIPSLNIGIECNGIYWHSELFKDKNYHNVKYQLCKEKGIQLIQVFENEWIHKKDIVKSIIENKMKLTSTRIFARKCKIQEINTEKNKFLSENHIQGNDKANVSIGLFYEGKLVSAMTFCKSRFNKNYEWELSRFCNKMNTSVVGASSKLLAYFERNYIPSSIITYADKRYSNGNLYNQLNFSLSHSSSPNYFYKQGTELLSRHRFQKHKLSGLLPIFDENKTEAENMKDNNYLRIYDCGNLVFTKVFN